MVEREDVGLLSEEVCFGVCGCEGIYDRMAVICALVKALSLDEQQEFLAGLRDIQRKRLKVTAFSPSDYVDQS